MEHLDSTDRKILNLLQHDGSLSATQVADKIGLSPGQTHEHYLINPITLNRY
ncbi:MAG: AsnC family protein, partial [Marinomonas sp.]|uniref:AsnC family protein n=1 Tax=Marinomonas sp. TaxID=1904862 RepID=UPI003F960345